MDLPSQAEMAPDDRASTLSLISNVGQRVRTLEPFVIVFLASTAGLIIEIVAARILAPHIGVSLYTWTSVIGIVLAGISAGNYAGGVVADRWGSRILLGVILFAAAVMSMAILPMANVVPGATDGLPVLLRIVLLTSILFFIPSMLLGMVTPVVIKLQLRDLSRTGNVVGKIYAISTFGSIFGVFISGFVLVSVMGSRSTVMLVAGALVVMAILFGRLWRAWIPGTLFAASFVGLALYAWTSGSFDSGCIRESNYFCIKVIDRVKDERPVKGLVLDQLVHSYVSLEDPELLTQGYEQILSEVASRTAFMNENLRTLFIGGGGYVLPRFMESRFPGSRNEVIEIDPEVTRVVYEELGLAAGSEIVTYNADARTQIPQLPSDQYDLVVGDAFNDVSVPYHLTTHEFNEEVDRLLTRGGIYATNVVDKVHSGNFLRSFVKTLDRTFEYVAVLGTDDNWTNDERTTTVVVASHEQFLPADLRLAALAMGKNEPAGNYMPSAVFNRWMDEEEAVFLTDDHTPVDQMLAPLYLESR